MPLVPPTSSSLFRPISDDKPWHTLLNASLHAQSSSTITPPESSLSQQSPPPSPPRSIASSTSTSSISVSLEPIAPLSSQYHTSVSSANNQSYNSAPSKGTYVSSDDQQVTPKRVPTQTPSPPHVVRFTAEHVTIGADQGIGSRKVSTRGARPRDLRFGSEEDFSSVKPKNEFVRIRPTHSTTTTVETSAAFGAREDAFMVRDQHDLLADLEDLSNMLTDHIDVTKGFVNCGERSRRPASGFIKRMLAKVRPVRGREKGKLAVEHSPVTPVVETPVKGESRFSSGIRDARDEMRQLVKVEDDVFGEYGDDLDDECWSESELQTLNGGKRQYLGFTKRNDTDIEAMYFDKAGLRRGRSSRLHGESGWRTRSGRRRSMDHGNRRDESGRLTRMSRSTVVVAKDWEELSKGRSRIRMRMKGGSHMDRRADRSEVEGRGGDVWGRWREDVGWGREQGMTAMPPTDLSTKILTRTEPSFRSADWSAGALSVSSITQASGTSSIN